MSPAAASLEDLRAIAPPTATRPVPVVVTRTLPCRCSGCVTRDTAGEEQAEISAPAHELHVLDGARLVLRWAGERGRFVGELWSEGWDDPDLAVAADTVTGLVEQLGRFAGAVSMPLRLRLEHDRRASC